MSESGIETVRDEHVDDEVPGTTSRSLPLNSRRITVAMMRQLAQGLDVYPPLVVGMS